MKNCTWLRSLQHWSSSVTCLDCWFAKFECRVAQLKAKRRKSPSNQGREMWRKQHETLFLTSFEINKELSTSWPLTQWKLFQTRVWKRLIRTHFLAHGFWWHHSRNKKRSNMQGNRCLCRSQRNACGWPVPTEVHHLFINFFCQC